MAISFIHTGDIHLEKTFHFKNQQRDFGKEHRIDLWLTFDQIINTAEKNHVDFLIISGDLFDTPDISSKALKRVAEKFAHLTETEVVICPGNHDFYTPSALYGLIEWPNNVTIFTQGQMESKYFEEKETRVFGIGWTKDTYEAMPFDGSHIDLSETDNNILVLHGDAYNQISQYMPIDLELFDYFDYVALGHIHRSERLTLRAAYCGCPEPLTFKNINDPGIFYGQIHHHRLELQKIETGKRKFFQKTLRVSPEMTQNDLLTACSDLGDDDSKRKDFFRIFLKGYAGADIDVEELRMQLAQMFYYVEVDDKKLLPNIDVDKLLEENQNNMIGRFIQEMRRNGDNPTARKALYYGLEGLLNSEDKG
ncbi:MAG: DNA repair exonuclease [Eubacteriaceae bacterium]|uniref:DNA repair exonuclease n=1 Tax=Candidatus Pseudoramibacter fermentans TaxID=2594427 RepID=A0A6L5GR19_9FIRM|nr:DNA repair exonuclease [Candidatus Pseudoramibacter fermentans]RRF93967.1 MAG: DNA repair exonuclease [Eubacteriaceae bacterium]